jgi:hypothetical protein
VDWCRFRIQHLCMLKVQSTVYMPCILHCIQHSVCFMVTKFMLFTPLYHISIDIYTPAIFFLFESITFCPLHLSYILSTGWRAPFKHVHTI